MLMSAIFTILVKIEPAKLRALRALDPYVPHALRILVPYVSLTLRVLVPQVPHVPRTLRALVPHVISALHTYEPHVLRALHALVSHVPRGSYTLCSPCSHYSRAFVPYVFRVFRVSICQYHLFYSCFPMLQVTFSYLFLTREFLCKIYHSLHKDNMQVAF